jgi:hypothetical protein
MMRHVSTVLLGAAAVGASATLLILTSQLLPSTSGLAVLMRLGVLAVPAVITNRILRSKVSYSALSTLVTSLLIGLLGSIVPVIFFAVSVVTSQQADAVLQAMVFAVIIPFFFVIAITAVGLFIIVKSKPGTTSV